MKKKQKDIFLRSEGNAWFERNRHSSCEKQFETNDPIVSALQTCVNSELGNLKEPRLLEIGCGDGKRLHWIAQNLNFKCYGVEPADQAVSIANTNGVQVSQGTADQLDFDDKFFDFVIFGFCLYLCDREDLFKIAEEADRVLKDPGFLVVHDFHSLSPTNKPYEHKQGVLSYKMDYRRLWDWNPSYTCFSHIVNHHSVLSFTEDQDEWVATSILRKSCV